MCGFRNQGTPSPTPVALHPSCSASNGDILPAKFDAVNPSTALFEAGCPETLSCALQASKPPVIALWMSRLMALGKQLDMYDEHLVEDCDKHMEQLINAFMTGHKVKGTPVPYPYAQLLNLGMQCLLVPATAPEAGQKLCRMAAWKAWPTVGVPFVDGCPIQ